MQLVRSVTIQTKLGSFTVDLTQQPADGSSAAQSDAAPLARWLWKWLEPKMTLETALGTFPPPPLPPFPIS